MFSPSIVPRFGALLVAGLLAASGCNETTFVPHDGGPGGDGGGKDGALGDAGNPPGDLSGADLSQVGGPDMASADLGPFMTAAHPAQPQVVTFNGPVLAAPKVQLIVYAQDPVAPDIDNMVTELTQTTTWSEQTAEYGVGALTKLTTIQIQGAPPAQLDDDTGNVTPFEQTLINNTSGANPPWGAADSSTIYTFLLPVGTNIKSGGNCCSDFLGYHWEVSVGNVKVPYAIVCDCPPFPNDPITPLQEVTTTVNHELDEAATDPQTNTSPAYYQADDNDSVWTYATGGEVGDMCEYNSDTNYIPPGSTYMVQRTWSNAAAAAGDNPCVPVPQMVYFNSMPVLNDAITISGAPSLGVKIAVGASKVVPVQLFSTAPTGPWKVTAYDLDDYLGYPPNTTVSLDKNSGSNGDILHLSIKVNSKDQSLGGEGFVLVSEFNGQQNISMGAVGN